MKGQAKMLSDILLGLLVVAIVVAIYFLFIGYYIIIRGIVNSADQERDTMNLGQILISSDMLAYSNGQTTYRGILDVEKLNSLDTSKLFKEINYPSYAYFFTVNNTESGHIWTFGDKVSGNGETVKTFPVAIKDGDEIQVGKISVHLRER
jgi:hypothetical protein